MKQVKCPNCGASINPRTSNPDFLLCDYCGSILTVYDSIGHSSERNNFDNVIIRVGQLIYNCDDYEAKKLLQDTLLNFPSDARLLELENFTRSFLTRDFGNYLKMLAACSFLCDGICGRYKNEINGFCNMLDCKADNCLNIAIYRKQNLFNYSMLLKYLVELKQCLANKAVIECDKLYDVVINAARKLSAIACNTIYLFKKKYYLPISFDLRRKLEDDFNKMNISENTAYFIVDEQQIRKYVE